MKTSDPNTGDDDSTQRGIDAMNRGLRSGFEDRLDPTRALALVRASAQEPREKLDYKSFKNMPIFKSENLNVDRKDNLFSLG